MVQRAQFIYVLLLIYYEKKYLQIDEEGTVDEFAALNLLSDLYKSEFTDIVHGCGTISK